MGLSTGTSTFYIYLGWFLLHSSRIGFIEQVINLGNQLNWINNSKEKVTKDFLTPTQRSIGTTIGTFSNSLNKDSKHKLESNKLDKPSQHANRQTPNLMLCFIKIIITINGFVMNTHPIPASISLKPTRANQPKPHNLFHLIQTYKNYNIFIFFYYKKIPEDHDLTYFHAKCI